MSLLPETSVNIFSECIYGSETSKITTFSDTKDMFPSWKGSYWWPNPDSHCTGEETGFYLMSHKS